MSIWEWLGDISGNNFNVGFLVFIFRREKQLPGYKPRKCGNMLKRSADKANRKRAQLYLPATLNGAHQPVVINPATVPAGESTTPSPTSPQKKALYAQLDGTTNNPESVVLATATPSTGRTKKFTRHRRVGSGTFNSPKSSPSRDRRMVQSEPETRHVKLVDTETQTDAMDVSETDASPSPNLSAKRMSTSLREEQDDEEEEEEEVDEGRDQMPELVQGYRCGKPQSEDDGEVPEDEENGNSISTGMTNSRSSEMLTSGHQQHPVEEEDEDEDEEVGKDREGCCSSPDMLMDAMNSNERLDRDCSDDDKIDTLDRKVSFISEKLQQQSILNDNSILIDNNVTVYTAGGKKGSLGKTAGKRMLDGGSTILMKHPAAGGYLNAGGSAVGAYVYRGEVVESGSPFHLTRAALQDQEGCNDSWTDEEGEEPIELYNYVLRRKW